jgi:hypothetical protein
MGITVLSAVIKHGWLEIPELNGGLNGRIVENHPTLYDFIWWMVQLVM